MIALLAVGFAHAAFLFGGELVPTGIGALAWTDEGKLSGTLAGEFDGLLRPPLTAQAGWVGRKDALTGGVALVRLVSATYADTSTYQSVGSTRFSADYRRYLFAREAGRVNLYGTAGAYFILPNAAETSEAYTPEEQAAADEDAGELRARIGGLGGQAGFAAQYLLGDAAGRPAVGIGLRYSARLYRGQASNEEGYSVSTVLLSEAALVVDFTR